MRSGSKRSSSLGRKFLYLSILGAVSLRHNSGSIRRAWNSKGQEDGHVFLSSMEGFGIHQPQSETHRYCSVVPPDDQTELPEGGVVYRLGGVSVPATADTEDDLLKRRYLTISSGGTEESTWDMLWSDFHGAFDQKKPANTTLSIPWREPHQPLFLVLWSDLRGAFDMVRYVEERSIPLERPGTSGRNSTTIHHGSVVGDCPAQQQHTKMRTEAIDSSKVFQYPRRRPNFRKRDESVTGLVTACTQLTVDRLPQLELIARTFGGPVSATIYVGFRGDDATVEAENVAKFWDGSAPMRRFVDVHLVFDDKRPWFPTGRDGTGRGSNPYPINLLRQISVDMASTEWILLIEADMLTVPDAHGLFLETWQDMTALYNTTGRAMAFAVPLYAIADNLTEGTLRKLPSDKGELVKMLGTNVTNSTFIEQMYMCCWRLNYRGWELLNGTRFLPYHRSGGLRNLERQEPYFVVRKEDMPPYNVLFAGMWYDKMAQVADMSDCGLSFYIHPTVYAINFSPQTETREWLSIKRNAGWRQSFVLAMRGVYREEFQRAIKGRTDLYSPCSTLLTALPRIKSLDVTKKRKSQTHKKKKKKVDYEKVMAHLKQHDYQRYRKMLEYGKRRQRHDHWR